MRRITLWILGTISALVLLFSYRTSTQAVLPQTEASGLSGMGKGAGEVSSEAAAAQGALRKAAAVTGAESSASPQSASGSTAADSASQSASASASQTTKAAAASSSLKDGTYLGDSVDTRWGPVQVQVKVSGGRITAADAVVYPTENGRDVEINSYAVPQLQQEALSVQSSSIDMVSGATYTSTGYTQSLQSALDQAAA